MARRGRRPLAVRPIILKPYLSLHPGEDDDLIAFFALYPTRLHGAVIKQALRSGKIQVQLTELPSDQEVEAALDGLLGTLPDT